MFDYMIRNIPADVEHSSSPRDVASHNIENALGLNRTICIQHIHAVIVDILRSCAVSVDENDKAYNTAGRGELYGSTVKPNTLVTRQKGHPCHMLRTVPHGAPSGSDSYSLTARVWECLENGRDEVILLTEKLPWITLFILFCRLLL